MNEKNLQNFELFSGKEIWVEKMLIYKKLIIDCLWCAMNC